MASDIVGSCRTITLQIYLAVLKFRKMSLSGLLLNFVSILNT